jgi:hypothetical protein
LPRHHLLPSQRVSETADRTPSPDHQVPARPDGGGRSESRFNLQALVNTWVMPFAAIGTLALLVFAISTLLDLWRSENFSAGDIVGSLLAAETEQARNTLGSLGEILAAVLGLALTVSSIIVQLAATRFTPIVTSLFFRDRTNWIVLSFFVVSNIYVLWVNFMVGQDSVPSYGVLLSMILMTCSLLLLFPYFSFVFIFLEPDSIISRITTDGLIASTPFRGRVRLPIGVRQREATQAVEHLANIGLNAVQQKDKNIASSATNALCNFAIYYGDTKAGMVQAWHAIPEWNRQSPDFVSLSDEAVADLRNRQTWLEWKILRQYQMLYGEGLNEMKDLCYLIAINTRRLGEAAARHGDLSTLDLAIKFFNTYLRATINATDVRTCYNILHQYRQLGEYVIEHTDANPEELIDQPLSMTSTLTVAVGGPAGDLSLLEERGLRIAGHMRYYSTVAFDKKMDFIAQVIAHDVSSLCARAFRADSVHHDELLKTFLQVDDSTKASERTLEGIRQAQIQLATTYLVAGAESYAKRIQADMQHESPDLLRGIWQKLATTKDSEFWEVNDRGSNFDYLSDEQKQQLPLFFSWFPGLRDEALTAMRGNRVGPAPRPR